MGGGEGKGYISKIHSVFIFKSFQNDKRNYTDKIPKIVLSMESISINTTNDAQIIMFLHLAFIFFIKIYSRD